MMVIYMRHATTGGTKVAISEAEATEDERHGWARYSPGALLTPAAPEPIYTDDINQLRKQWSAKFGKTPHHKKSVETLKKELTNDDGTGAY